MSARVTAASATSPLSGRAKLGDRLTATATGNLANRTFRDLRCARHRPMIVAIAELRGHSRTVGGGMGGRA